jgi:hypothetical protein
MSARADHPAGDLVQSLTYRESYTPATPTPPAVVWPPRRRVVDDTPPVLRSAVAAGWALLQLVTALALVAVVLVLLARVLGALT